MTARGEKPVRVLIVDDSALVRKILRDAFDADPETAVVGEAANPYDARDLLVRLRPDVVTLDVDMPRMDGVSFLRKFMAVVPTPTIVFSSLVGKDPGIAKQALEAGAVGVVCKPATGIAAGVAPLLEDLVQQVKAARGASVSDTTRSVRQDAAPGPLPKTTDKVVGIGASTGGVSALGRLLPHLPPSTPGVVIVQHMPGGFTHDFAERLDMSCAVQVREASDGDRVWPGRVLIAPGGDRHCEVHRTGGVYRVRLRNGPPVSGHIPSVDVLFESLATAAGENGVGCILTGMGADGARGLLAMRRSGARTIGQSRETCAVWGMPAAAEALGAVLEWVALEEMAGAIVAATRARETAPR